MGNSKIINKMAAACILAAAGLSIVAPKGAGAQAMVSDPAVIGQCLCLQQSVATKRAEMTARQRAFDLLQKSIADQTATLESRRPGVNVDDPAAVQSFRDALDNRDADAERLERETYPDLQNAIAVYNQRVDQYNQSCAGKNFNDQDIARVRAALTCPAD